MIPSTSPPVRPSDQGIGHSMSPRKTITVGHWHRGASRAFPTPAAMRCMPVRGAGAAGRFPR